MLRSHSKAPQQTYSAAWRQYKLGKKYHADILHGTGELHCTQSWIQCSYTPSVYSVSLNNRKRTQWRANILWSHGISTAISVHWVVGEELINAVPEQHLSIPAWLILQFSFSSLISLYQSIIRLKVLQSQIQDLKESFQVARNVKPKN